MVIGSAVEDLAAAVIGLVVEALGALADLLGAVDFVAVGSEAGDEINAWSVQSYFL